MRTATHATPRTAKPARALACWLWLLLVAVFVLPQATVVCVGHGEGAHLEWIHAQDESPSVADAHRDAGLWGGDCLVPAGAYCVDAHFEAWKDGPQPARVRLPDPAPAFGLADRLALAPAPECAEPMLATATGPPRPDPGAQLRRTVVLLI